MGTNILIIGSSLLVMALLGLSPAVKAYWQTLWQRPGPALTLIGAMAAPFIGGTAYDASSLLPDATRLIRLLVLMSILAMSMNGILNSSTCWKNAGKGTKWMLIYALFAMSSAIYSLAPLISFWKGFEVFILIMVAIYLAGLLRTLDDVRWLMNLLTLMLLFLCMTVIMGVLVEPGEAFRAGSAENASEITRTVRGVVGSINPASVGGIGALLFITTFATIFDNRTHGKLGLWIILGISTSVLFFAHSRTAIFGTTAAVITILIYNRRLGIAIGMGVVGILLTAFTSVSDSILAYIYRGQSQELFLSMSGRTYHWDLIAEHAMDAPILGYGFYAGIRVIFGTSSSDNSYLGVFLDLGLVGLTLFVIPIFILAHTLWKTRPRRSMPWDGDTIWLQIAGLFVVILLRSPVSTSFQILHNILVIYLVLQIGAAALSRQWRDARIPRADRSKTDEAQTDLTARLSSQPRLLSAAKSRRCTR